MRALAVVTAVPLCAVFPTRVRYTASAVTYNVAYAIFGGAAPVIAARLIAATGHRMASVIYITTVAVVAFVVALLTPETAGRPFRASGRERLAHRIRSRPRPAPEPA